VPRCQRCGDKLQLDKIVLSGKSKGAWRCSLCNTKGVQLSRNGKFRCLLKSFKEHKLSASDRQDFWKSTHEMSQTDLNQLVDEKYTIKLVDSKSTGRRGQYLPLSVYEKQGYDVNTIANYCKDVIDDPILGKCYNIMILSEDEHKTKEDTFEQTMQDSDRPTSSSKPPSAKAKAKGKALSAPKASKSLAFECAKIITKITPVKLHMQVLLKRNSSLSKIKAEDVKKTKELLGQLVDLESKAAAIMKGKEAPPEFDQINVDELVKAAKKQHSFIESLIKIYDQQ
jgi:hypothetical protein